MSTARMKNGPRVDTTIADTLAGADELSVIADRLEEISTRDVVKLAAAAAGDAYRIAARALESRGRTLNAREAWQKAATHYKRAESTYRERACRDRAIANRPPSGNIYADAGMLE